MSSSMDIIRKAEKAERELKKRKRPTPSILLTRTTEDPSCQSDEISENKVKHHNYSQQLDIDIKQKTHRNSPGSEMLQIPSVTDSIHNHSSIELGRNDSPLVLVNSFTQYVDQNSAQNRQKTKNDNQTYEQLLPYRMVKNQIGFYRNQDGQLMCEGLKIKDIQQSIKTSPFYLMSKGQLEHNFNNYVEAIAGLDSAFIGYAVKANNNMNVLKHLANLGSGAVLVSGNEIRVALRAGFSPTKMVFNGNGKSQDDLNLAVENNILVNIDSEFDLEHIIQASLNTGKKARALLRINPDIDPKVHPYVSTGLADSKFGIENDKLEYYLNRIKECSEHIQLLGVHCHIGSTIKEVQIFKDAANIMAQFVQRIRAEGFDLQYLNLGGGLGIDYNRNGQSEIPSPKDLLGEIRETIIQMNLKLIIEPGRSLVGNTTVFVSKVIGVKQNGNKNFIVVDGSMSELIRPSLYGAYHHIELAESSTEEQKVFDIVGPVCESADFLGKLRQLPTPKENDCLVVYDTGAYCQAMSSTYNLKLTCAEYWVEDTDLILIRKAQNLESFLEQFNCETMEKHVLTSQNVKPQQEKRIKINSSKIKKQRSNLEMDSIDEDENEQFLSPERLEVKSKLIEINSASRLSNNIKLNSVAGNSAGLDCGSDSLNDSREEIFPAKRETAKDQASSESVSLDSEEEDLKFLREQEEEMALSSGSEGNLQTNKPNKPMLSDDAPSNPMFTIEEQDYNQILVTTRISHGPNNSFQQQFFDEIDARPAVFPRQDPSRVLSNGSPTTKKLIKQKGQPKATDDKDFYASPYLQKHHQEFDIGPSAEIESGASRTSEKVQPTHKGQNNIISPVKFLSQRKKPIFRQVQAPFEIKAINYIPESNYDDDNILSRNGGHEIDVHQFTNQYDQDEEMENIDMAYQRSEKPKSSKPLTKQKTVDILPNRTVAVSQAQYDPVDYMNFEEIKGLGSAGIRLSSSNIALNQKSKILQKSGSKQESSASSRRDEMRNRLKKTSNFVSITQFSQVRGGTNDNFDIQSSTSSKYVVKLDGGNNDLDIQSQKEFEYRNRFEQTYTEHEILGQGCSSTVKKCEHKITKQIRAVKIIRSDDDEYMEISKMEFKLLKNLNCQWVVKVYDCIHDESKHRLYLIMELIKGETLEDFILKKDDNQFISESLVKQIIKQLLTAIQYIHSNGICHRDLKPDNVLIDPKTSQIKLTDFNVSKRFMEIIEPMNEKQDWKIDMNGSFIDDLSPLELAGKQEKQLSLTNFKPNEKKKIPMRSLTGLDQWSAPETRQGGEYTEAVDMWGVGVIIYHVITKHAPFINDEDEQRILEDVQNCNYEPFSQDCLDFYSDNIINFVKSLIVANPNSRLTPKQALELHWLQNVSIEYNSPSKKSQIPDTHFQPSSYISPRKDNRINQKRPGAIVNGIFQQQKTKAERYSSLNQPQKDQDPEGDFDIYYDVIPDSGTNQEFCNILPKTPLVIGQNLDDQNESPEQFGLQKTKSIRDKPQTRVMNDNSTSQANIVNQQINLLHQKKSPRKSIQMLPGQSIEQLKEIKTPTLIKLHKVQIGTPGSFSDIDENEQNEMLTNKNENYIKNTPVFRHKKTLEDFTGQYIEFNEFKQSPQFPKQLVNDCFGNFSLNNQNRKKQNLKKDQQVRTMSQQN